MNLPFRSTASLWTYSFRPFFLGAALHAILAILVWVLILFSAFPISNLTANVQFHSYEMVFGFARAAVLGFLFTAAQNWTKTTILKEKSLMFLFSLWLLGRFGFHTNPYISTLSFGLDILCDIATLYYLAPPLLKKGQNHNRIIVFTYSILFILHVLTVLSVTKTIPAEFSLHFIHNSIFVIVYVIILIGGRILPFFTSVAAPGSFPKKFQGLESAVQYMGLLFLVQEFAAFWFPDRHFLYSILCFSYAILNSVRWLFWEPWKAIKIPILIVLHIGYFWVILGLAAYGLFRIGLIPSSPAYHILTTGGIGVFIYGMITRVSLGHTGRPIRASRSIIFGYIFINLAVLSRSLLPLIDRNREAYIISASFWVLSFLLFIAQYTGILLRPRADQLAK